MISARASATGWSSCPSAPGCSRATTCVYCGQLGLYAGQRPHERVLVVLALLGGQQRVGLAKDAIELVRRD